MKLIVILSCLLLSLISINVLADSDSADPNRLEELAKTLSSGSYTHPNDIELPKVNYSNLPSIRKSIEQADRQIGNESKNRKSQKMHSKNAQLGCSCSSYKYCIGPRGGRYCYTSGGNKSYR